MSRSTHRGCPSSLEKSKTPSWRSSMTMTQASVRRFRSFNQSHPPVLNFWSMFVLLNLFLHLESSGRFPPSCFEQIRSILIMWCIPWVVLRSDGFSYGLSLIHRFLTCNLLINLRAYLCVTIIYVHGQKKVNGRNTAVYVRHYDMCVHWKACILNPASVRAHFSAVFDLIR